MKKTILSVFVLVVSLLSSGFAPIGTVADFRLRNVDGRYVSLKDYPDAKGFIIVFTCNHCPFAKLYPGRLNEINARYKKLGVPLLAISSTDTVIYSSDSYTEMVAKARAGIYNFPYLYDDLQVVARNFNAQKTPHAYVIWKENGQWVVKYSGGIDDNGAHPELVKSHYVTDAVDALLAGKAVATQETKSIGCKIMFR